MKFSITGTKFVLLLALCWTVLASDGLDLSCSTDSDCQGPYESCNLSKSECEHKGVFPLHAREFFGSLLLGVMLSLANAAGIGGGSLIVPICILVLGFRTKQAVALSNFCTFSAALSRFILNYKASHPEKDAKIIDYNVVLIMFPLVMMGALVGVQVNMIMPELILLIGLICLFSFTSIKSFMSSFTLRKQENSRRKESQKVDCENKEEDPKDNNSPRDEESSVNHEHSSPSPRPSSNQNETNNALVVSNPSAEGNERRDDTHLPPINHPSVQKPSTPPKPQNEDPVIASSPKKAKLSQEETSQNGSKGDQAQELHPELAKILAKERTHCKPVSLFIVPAIFVVVIFISLLRGSGSAESIIGLSSCHPVNFVLLVLLFLFFVCVTVFNIYLVKREHNIKIKHGYEFAENELKWGKKLLIQFLICAFSAGFIAGTVGIGGGVIFNLVLLSFHVPVQVAASTGMFMIMFSTLSNSFLFILAGYMEIGYAFWLGCFTAIATFLGLNIVKTVIKKTGRSSYLVLLLGIFIGISAIVVTINGSLQLAEDQKNGKNLFEMGSFCD